MSGQRKVNVFVDDEFVDFVDAEAVDYDNSNIAYRIWHHDDNTLTIHIENPVREREGGQTMFVARRSREALREMLQGVLAGLDRTSLRARRPRQLNGPGRRGPAGRAVRRSSYAKASNPGAAGPDDKGGENDPCQNRIRLRCVREFRFQHILAARLRHHHSGRCAASGRKAPQEPRGAAAAQAAVAAQAGAVRRALRLPPAAGALCGNGSRVTTTTT